MSGLSEQQEECKRHFLVWWQSNPKTRKPFFRIDGYAGSGKTYSIKHIVEGIEGVVQLAPTGKSALVATQKTGRYTRTVHKALYIPKGSGAPNKERISEIKATMDKLEAQLRDWCGITETEIGLHPSMVFWQKKLDAEENVNNPIFKLNDDTDLKRAKLIYLTEASMIYESMARDLLALNVPILMEGDPGQLPPVGGDGYFMRGAPDFFLDEIHRQAEGSPILKLATMARNGEHIPLGDYGDGCMVVKKISAELALQADQIIVGKNETRHKKNYAARLMKGFISSEVINDDVFVPRTGEKLICLRNNDDEGVINGSLWKCLKAERYTASKLHMKVMEEGCNYATNVTAHSQLFRGLLQKQMPQWMLCQRGVTQFDFGYAITCHKSQGSQWDFVVVYDESRNMGSSKQWLYTALTRAAKRLVIVTQ